MTLKILIHPAEEGDFWVEIPALRGCLSQGETLEEAWLNIQEAAVGWLEVATELALRGTTADLLVPNSP